MNRPFRIILAAETISMVGSQVTLVALPLTAVLLLHADAFEMGLLRAASALPSVVFGLFAGVLIDRWPKRRVLLAANAVSALVMALVPIAMGVKLLSLGLLMGVSFVGSTVNLGEQIGLSAFIPAIVPTDRLARANGRFGAMRSGASLVGPAVAGLLIAAFSAAGAIAVDAASFAVAFVLMMLLPVVPVPAPNHAEGSVWTRLRAGVAFIRADPVLQPLMAIAVALNFFLAIVGALGALFIVRYLGVKPEWYGIALAAGGIGAIVGATLAERLARTFGVMKLLTGTLGFFVIGLAGISALQGPPVIVAVSFGGCQIVFGFGSAVFSATFMTHVQKATPGPMLARVMGVIIASFGAAVPVGALIGGAVAAVIGVRQTLIVATVGFTGAVGVMMLRTWRRGMVVGVVGDGG